MLGIQRTFGPNRLNNAKSVDLVNRNEYSNGDAHKYTSSSYSNSIPKVPLHTKLMKKIQEFYSFIVFYVNCCVGTFPIL